MLQQKLFINLVQTNSEHKKHKIMLELEKFGVAEMSIQEQKETEGGFFGLLVGLFMVWCFANLVTDGSLAP